MKELSIEEKAKRYDEALIKARNIVNSINVGLIGKDSFEAVFPELKESNDEKIRKALINTFKYYHTNESPYMDGISNESVVAYLEKQGEQKPTEWSEEDEKIVIQIRDAVENYFPTIVADKIKNWLKSLKDRVQPKQEWSEEDDKERKHIIGLLEGWMNTFKETIYKKDCKEGITWLKSLRPQSTWKPSDEQMNALEAVLTVSPQSPAMTSALIELYEDLKKLKG